MRLVVVHAPMVAAAARIPLSLLLPLLPLLADLPLALSTRRGKPPSCVLSDNSYSTPELHMVLLLLAEVLVVDYLACTADRQVEVSVG